MKFRRLIVFALVLTMALTATTALASACSCQTIDRSKQTKVELVNKKYKGVTYEKYKRIGYPKYVQKGTLYTVGSASGSKQTYSVSVSGSPVSSIATITAKCGYSSTKFSVNYSSRSIYGQNKYAAPYKRASYQLYSITEKQRLYCKTHRQYMTKYNRNGYVNGVKSYTYTVKIPYAHKDAKSFKWMQSTSKSKLPATL